MDSPLVSVIIPVCNGAAYLAEAIESVLAQTYAPLELTVVNDGSTDDSSQIAASYGSVRLINQSNAGAAAARNRGIQDAGGMFLAFLDADDLWMPDKVEIQMALLRRRPEVELVTGLVESFISPELQASDFAGITVPSEGLPGYIPSAILCTRKAFERVGSFDEELTSGEFLSWGMRAIERLAIETLPLPVVRRRIHLAHLNGRGLQDNRMILRLIKASLDRRRGKTL